jgi:hypothetical protein
LPMLPCPMVFPKSHVPVDVVTEVRLLPLDGWLKAGGRSVYAVGCGAEVGPPLATAVAPDISVLFREDPGREEARC